jgi:UDP-N-acetylmuramyl tripeptide synthase
MTIHLSRQVSLDRTWAPPSFRAWQRHVLGLGLLPVISVAGDRGKSTVIRLLDAIFTRAGLRTATWTDLGVEIRHRRQRGEISGWSLALNRLAEGTIDLAIQELHWSMINTVGLPPSSYPLVGITNLFPGHDGPDFDGHESAIKGTMRAMAAVHPQGSLVIGADEFALYDAAESVPGELIVTALSPESPGLRRHLASEGAGFWVDHGEIVGGAAGHASAISPVDKLPFCLHGASTFLTSSALEAAALAMAVGVDPPTIGTALASFSTTDDILPGSFNTYSVNGYRIVIDRLSNSAHLRQVIRAINPGHQRRQISVINDLGQLPSMHIAEFGRMLGRHAGVVILHSNEDASRLEAFRRGVAANEFPPLFASLPTERRAINRALKLARPEDAILLLTGEDPGPVIRAIRRHAELESSI